MVGQALLASVLLADMSTASDSPRFGVVGFLSSASAEKGVKLLQRSPGPVYKPDDAWFGKGPHGIGPEYSMRASHRFPLNERNTKQVFFPGPKYMMPKGLGRQAESTKRSFNAGKFSNCPRHTMDPGPEVTTASLPPCTGTAMTTAIVTYERRPCPCSCPCSRARAASRLVAAISGAGCLQPRGPWAGDRGARDGAE